MPALPRGLARFCPLTALKAVGGIPFFTRKRRDWHTHQLEGLGITSAADSSNNLKTND
jgi:hypothetical protein